MSSTIIILYLLNFPFAITVNLPFDLSIGKIIVCYVYISPCLEQNFIKTKQATDNLKYGIK